VLAGWLLFPRVAAAPASGPAAGGCSSEGEPPGACDPPLRPDPGGARWHLRPGVRSRTARGWRVSWQSAGAVHLCPPRAHADARRGLSALGRRGPVSMAPQRACPDVTPSIPVRSWRRATRMAPGADGVSGFDAARSSAQTWAGAVAPGWTPA